VNEESWDLDDSPPARILSQMAKHPHFTNLDGFVLFDTMNKYEIDFPSGWENEAKESKASR